MKKKDRGAAPEGKVSMNICPGIKSKSFLFLLVCLNALSAFAAEAITGKVLNLTTNRPAAGDKVILLRLENGKMATTWIDPVPRKENASIHG